MWGTRALCLLMMLRWLSITRVMVWFEIKHPVPEFGGECTTVDEALSSKISNYFIRICHSFGASKNSHMWHSYLQEFNDTTNFRQMCCYAESVKLVVVSSIWTDSIFANLRHSAKENSLERRHQRRHGDAAQFSENMFWYITPFCCIIGPIVICMYRPGSLVIIVCTYYMYCFLICWRPIPDLLCQQLVTKYLCTSQCFSSTSWMRYHMSFGR